MAVGTGRYLLMHELAFVDDTRFVEELRRLLGDELVVFRASKGELPPENAVAAYPFNSQLLALDDGTMAIVAPEDAREDKYARAFLERVVSEGGPLWRLHYIDVRQSMQNGGGPACLRLRVPLTDEETHGLGGRVLVDDALHAELVAWVDKHYRDRLVPTDLADPKLAREIMTGLDELTRILGLGAVYDFQR
jgi:succinylarginine dihydrolase